MRRAGRHKGDSLLSRRFGDRLRRLREDRGLSQRQLARSSNIDPSQVGRYEKGQILPAADTIITIAKVLQVSVDALLVGADQESAAAPPIRNLPLFERFRSAEKLGRKDQETIMEVIDSVVTRRQVESMVANGRAGKLAS